MGTTTRRRLAMLATAVVLGALLGIGSWRAMASPQVPIERVEYKCYTLPQGRALNQDVGLNDQFGDETVVVQQPLLLCNPATKIVNGVVFTAEAPHLKCYKIVPSASVNQRVNLTDQFHREENVLVTAAQILCTEVTKEEVAAPPTQ